MTEKEQIEKEAEGFLKEMSLEQKLGQLQCVQLGREPLLEAMAKYPYGVGQVTVFGGKPSAKENQKLAEDIQETAEQYSDIPPIMHGEAVTGYNAAQATVFPSAIGLGATWEPELVEEMADIIRKQMLSVGVRQALSPVMDVARDPRWGRMGETYGEDPTLCAEMSVAFTKGLQTEDLTNGVLATGKHFLGYGRSEGGLNMAANPIPLRELIEVYAKPFQAAITEADLGSIMNSYGSIDGDLVIQSEDILDTLLRCEMEFQGIVVSDYMSIDKAVDLKLCESPLEGGKHALEAGLDMELPGPYGYSEQLLESIKSGEVPERLLDRAVKRILKTKIKMGLLQDALPKEELFEEAYHQEKNREYSLKAARKSIVLLKNDGILPLEKTKQKIAVIGPHANSLRLLFGCYTYPATLDMMLSGSMRDVAGLENTGKSAGEKPTYDCYPGSDVRRESEKVRETLEKLYGVETPTILEAIRAICPQAEITYEEGCDIAGNDKSRFQEAVRVAKEADVVILTMGGKYGWGANCTTGEGIDTDQIGLPGIQEQLAQLIFQTGTPCVLVHMDTKPLSSEFISKHYDAIIENWFPGDSGGQALAEVLFGDYNPAGRLPVTAARNAGQIPIYASHKRGSGYSKTLGMTLSKYVEGTKQPLHYFGEGLSYTTFEYSNLQMDTQVSADGTIIIQCDVKNTGERDGEEVVQMYFSDIIASLLRPNQELAGFKRVALKVGEKKTVQFVMKADQTAFLDKGMDWVVEAGEIEIRIGSASNKIHLKGTCCITDTKKIIGSKRGFYAQTRIM